MSLLDESVWWWLRAYTMFDKGILPNNKGWAYQTNKYLEIMNFISTKISERINDGQ